MKPFTFLALVVAAALITDGPAKAQDYIAQVQQIQNELRQQADMHAAQAVQAYRQETGDWTTPDQQVFDWLVYQSRQANPGFYADLANRERAFYAQQQNYAANRNAIMDGMHQSYLNQSDSQHRSHQNFVQGVIWERSNYTDGTNVYDLPYYQPGNVYQGQNGSMIYQDYSGQYNQYDAGGGYTEMNEID
jgi:hypothetical protein